MKIEKMDSIKFLGICILLSSILLSAAIIWHKEPSRYQLYVPESQYDVLRLDTKTGEVQRGDNIVMPAK